MAENTKIEWADHTFNPWIGCAKVHTGCQNCYAESDMDTRRGRVKWGLHGTRSATTMAYWQNPLKWNRLGAANRPRVFCASLADVFEDWQGPVIDSQHRRLFTINGAEWFTEAEYPDCRPLTIADLRRKLFETIDATPNLDFLLLTKRPQNVRGMWSGVCHDTDMGGNGVTMTMHRRNVHLLYSASDQPSLEAGIDHLLACRPLVPVLGLSLEPLVGPVDLSPWLLGGERNVQTCSTCDGEGVPKDVIAKHAAVCQYMSHDINDGAERVCNSCGSMLPACAACEETGGKVYLPTIDWVIVGGESGPGARPCTPADSGAPIPTHQG